MYLTKVLIPSALVLATSLVLVAGSAQAKPPFLKPGFNAAAKAPQVKPQFNWAARKPAPIARGFNGAASGKPAPITKPFNNAARKPIVPRTRTQTGTAGHNGPRFPTPVFRPGGF
jgi:hypothetical protein